MHFQIVAKKYENFENFQFFNFENLHFQIVAKKYEGEWIDDKMAGSATIEY